MTAFDALHALLHINQLNLAYGSLYRNMPEIIRFILNIRLLSSYRTIFYDQKCSEDGQGIDYLKISTHNNYERW